MVWSVEAHTRTCDGMLRLVDVTWWAKVAQPVVCCCFMLSISSSAQHFQPTCANADAIAFEIALDEPLAMACESAFALEEPPPVLEANASALAAANAAAWDPPAACACAWAVATAWAFPEPSAEAMALARALATALLSPCKHKSKQHK